MITHDELGEIAAKRLKRIGYHVAFSNVTDTNLGEQPDCIGVSLCGDSILIEAKVSRSDFKADFKKPWRADGKGLGKRRVYITPEGLLSPAEIPYGWQLWEVKDNKRKNVIVTKGMREKRVKSDKFSFRYLEKTLINMEKEEYNFFANTDDLEKVICMMTKVFRRMEASGINYDNYSNGSQLRNK